VTILGDILKEEIQMIDGPSWS